MMNKEWWIPRNALLLLVAVLAAAAANARAQELSMPVRLSALTSPGTRVVWGQLEFSEFVITGAAAGVTLSGSSQGHLHGLYFAIDPGSLVANGEGVVSRLNVTYTVRPTTGGATIGGVELTTAGVTTGLGFASNTFTFYDNAFTGIATPLGRGAARYMGPTRDVEVLREATTGLSVSGSLSARTVFASDFASMSLSTHRFALTSDIPSGDYDLNGRVDGADFLKWQRSFGEGSEDGLSLNSNLDADGNHDGKVDAADLTIWRDNYGTQIGPPGDFDGDGDVDGADFLTWQRAFGSNDPAVDANGNGIVDAADFTIWRDNYGTGSSIAEQNLTAVPEPSTTSLMIIGAGITVVLLRNVSRR